MKSVVLALGAFATNLLSGSRNYLLLPPGYIDKAPKGLGREPDIAKLGPAVRRASQRDGRINQLRRKWSVK